MNPYWTDLSPPNTIWIYLEKSFGTSPVAQLNITDNSKVLPQQTYNYEELLFDVDGILPNRALSAMRKHGG